MKSKKEAFAAPAPQLKGASLPELAGCELELDWRDFKGLLEAHLKAQAESASAEPGEEQPRAAVLGTVRASGEVGGNAAHLSASLSLEVTGSGWVFVPLVRGELALSEVSFDGRPSVLTGRSDPPELGILIEGPRTGLLELAFTVPLLVQAAQSGFGFGLPLAPALELELRLPGEQELDLKVTPAVRQESRREGAATLLSASVPAPREVQVRWTLAAPDEPAAPVEVHEPILQVEVQTLAQIGDGALRLESRLQVEVLRAPQREFFLDLPPGTVLADLSAPRLAFYEAVPDEGRGEDGAERLRVVLEQGVEGSLALELRCEGQLSDQGQLSLRAPRLVGAQRDQGYLALAPLTNLDLATPEVEGARRIDPRELPPALSARAQRSVLHAFHYAGTEPRIEVLATKHPELPVLTTVVDQAAFLVLVTEDGQRYVQARYTVRNAQQQFLRVELGPGEELLSALLEEEPVKPAIGGEQAVLIPLRRAADPREAERAFSVELVTRTSQAALGERGELTLGLPRVELPIAYLTCELHLPLGYVYDDFQGTLTEVDGFRTPLVTRSDLLARWAPRAQIVPAASMAPPPPPQGSRARRMSAPQAQQVQQAMEVFAEGPMEELDALCERDESPALELGGGYASGFGGLEAGRPGLAAPDAGGRLPIRIEVPAQGERFRFERLLCLGEALNLQSDYTRERR